MGACGSGSGGTAASGNGIDESQIAANSSLKANIQNVVALHLEHPQGGEMEGDTGGIGNDVIPFSFDFAAPQAVQFCFSADLPHQFNITNAQGVVLMSLEAQSCGSVTLPKGDYSLNFQNAGTGGVAVSNFFIRRDLSSSVPRILIEADCPNCDLSGIHIEEIDLSGLDFSGSNFNDSELLGDDFRGSNLDNTTFEGSDWTGSLFDDDDSIFEGEEVQQAWVTDDGAYSLLFTFDYQQAGQMPQIQLQLFSNANGSSQELLFQSFEDSALSFSLSAAEGSFSVENLHPEGSSDDAGIYGSFCWGSGLSSCVQGVLVSFNSFGAYPSASLVSADLAALSTSMVMLNFINNSSSLSNTPVVVFQKNLASSFDEAAVAWRVLQNVGQGWNYPFEFPSSYAIAASDSYGNFTPQYSIVPGDLFAMQLTDSGDQLVYAGQATSIQEMQMLNGLSIGSVNASLYKDGLLLATTTNIAPAQKAVFQFKPTIWIGVVEEVEEGDVMNSAILANINTQFSLLGIASADIVMTGGGSTPFQFSLSNVVFQ